MQQQIIFAVTINCNYRYGKSLMDKNIELEIGLN